MTTTTVYLQYMLIRNNNDNHSITINIAITSIIITTIMPMIKQAKDDDQLQHGEDEDSAVATTSMYADSSSLI
jgi:hypothetical protein